MLDELDISPVLEEPTVYLGRQSPEHKRSGQCDNRHKVQRSF